MPIGATWAEVAAGAPSVAADEVYQLGLHVRALAAVHDLLTQESKAGDGQANFLSARELLHQLMPMLQATSVDRKMEFQIADVRLSARQGSSLALIVNELVCNALKYGDGTIRVSLCSTDATATLVVTDDGLGFCEGFDSISSVNTGLDLVTQLTRWDLGGEISYCNHADSGARITITIPLSDRNDL